MAAAIDPTRIKPKYPEVPIDPLISQLNIVELYMVKYMEYDGDFLRIQLWFEKQGFLATYPYRNDSYESKLPGFAAELHKQGVTSTSDLDPLKLKTSFVILKYKEMPGPHYWKNMWAKQCRGTVLFVNPETSEVTCLNYKLPRGAEVMSSYQQKSGITETQDIDESFSILDDDQIDTCERLVRNEPICGHLSSKGDGSLMTVTLYQGKKLHIMNALINTFGSDYIKLWQEMSLSNS